MTIWYKLSFSVGNQFIILKNFLIHEMIFKAFPVALKEFYFSINYTSLIPKFLKNILVLKTLIGLFYLGLKLYTLLVEQYQSAKKIFFDTLGWLYVTKSSPVKRSKYKRSLEDILKEKKMEKMK